MENNSNNVIDKTNVETVEEASNPILQNDIVQETSTEANHEFTDDKSININDISNNTHNYKKYIIIASIILGIIIFTLIFSAIFALLNKNSDKIISGVTINSIDVSGLTHNEAREKISKKLNEELNTTLSLTYEDYKNSFVPVQDIDAIYDISSVIDTAYSIGRSSNIFKSNYEILYTLVGKQKLHANLKYNQDKLNTLVNDISLELPGVVKQPSYYIEDTNLIIEKGEAGIRLLENETQNLIIDTIKNISNSNTLILPTETVEPNEIDITKIYNEIHSEPKNAYIVQEPFELNLGFPGTDFAITIEEANNIVKEDKSEYIIPLKITQPDITVEDLGDGIFSQNLGNYSTKYNVANYNRTTNVELATRKINNVVLLPGQEFSYNKVVGKRTIANGFKEASVYTSSGVVNGLGGGICQVSSTLYNAVLDANLEITERKNHRYTVVYVPLGRDATVAYGSIDFKFKNNRKYPIKVVAYAKNGICNIAIKGIKEEVEYDVSITTKKLQSVPFETKYINDSSLEVGKQVVTQEGDYGYKYEAYKTLKLNGNIVSTTLLSTDTYTPLSKVIKVGTKQPEPQTTVVPEKPSTPQVPEVPTNPVNPETPQNPVAPETPELSGKPENTEGAQKPAIPSNGNNALGNSGGTSIENSPSQT